MTKKVENDRQLDKLDNKTKREGQKVTDKK